MHFKDSYTNVSNSPSTLLLRRGGSALLLGLHIQNEVPFFKRGALQELTRLVFARRQRRASIFVPLFLVLYPQPHLLMREAFVSVAPLLTSLKCTSSLCRGPS